MATAAMPTARCVPGFSYPAERPLGFRGRAKLDLDSTLVERCLSGDSTGWEDQLPVLEEGVASPSRPDRMLAGREASEILQAALQKLSPDLRETLILRDLQEMEYREIADVLKIPEGTVKSRLNRGRAELARLLKFKMGHSQLGHAPGR